MNNLIYWSIAVCMISHVCVAESGDGFPSEFEVEDAFCKTNTCQNGAYPHWYSVVKRIRLFRADATPEEIVRAESCAISKLLAIPSGTAVDAVLPTVELLEKSRCLAEVACWPSVYADTNLLMRIADDLSRYVELPDLRGTKAQLLADQLDNILEYGTNAVPRRCGVVRYGQIGLAISRLSNARTAYNRQVAAMRKSRLNSFCNGIMRVWFNDVAETERRIILREFLRRAAVTDAELRTLSRDAADMRWIEQDVHPGGVNPPADDEPNGEDDHTER